MMSDTQLMTCCRACATGLREDRRSGLIYGPYGKEDEQGKLVLIGALEFAGLSGTCIYDNQPLPRGRAKRILAELERRREK